MVRHLIAFIAAFVLLTSQVSCTASDVITLRPGFPIYVANDAPEPVHNALTILQRDLKNVLGQESAITHNIADLNGKSALIIVTESLSADTFHIETLEGFEAHRVFTRDDSVIVQGADIRGTIFAILTFSEQFLGIKPLWYWASLKPERKQTVEVPANSAYSSGSPDVKYRAWFPNDQDMFTPWRQRSEANNGVWLETMLRLKLNTVNWNGNTFATPYTVDDDFKLIKKYGLYVTFHHHNPMNACFSGWERYWTEHKKQPAPALLLANEEKIKEYWRYCARTLVRNQMDVIWVVNFRGNTDGPYWDTFTDAPEAMTERAAVINRLVSDQIEIIRQETGEANPPIRMIFYNELSDLLAEGLLEPPTGENIIWTFVAARRDHFPNFDLRQAKIPAGVGIGYYMNLQFTSTGSHLAQAEGPWKMEQNYRYVAAKGPLVFSELNAGNLREHLLGLSANAQMLWDMQDYSTDEFVLDFSNEYFGTEHGQAAAELYKAFFNAYWNPKRSDIEGFDRQYIFHDLRYQKAVGQLAKVFAKPYNPNPLRDFPNEQLAGRTFRIEPADNNADNQVDAILNGTRESMAQFQDVADGADALYQKLDETSKPFFNDNLRAQAHFMLHLNKTLHQYFLAYKSQETDLRQEHLAEASRQARSAQQAILQAAHGEFSEWYAQERIFNLKTFVKTVQDTRP